MKRITKLITAALLALTQTAMAAEQVIYYHNDALGSPVAATDDTGSLLWEQHYGPWGAPLTPVAGDPRGYTGKPYDEDTGLQDFQARWYSASIGRFHAIDPAGFSQANIHSFNRYAYANNNPYRFVDPDGRSAVTAFGGVIYESYQFLSGNGFNGTRVLGALVDGYNGEGRGFASAAFEDATTFVPAGIVGGVAIKALRLVKAGRATKNVERVTSSGIRVSRHSVQQKINRGVRSIDELDALKNPLKVNPTKFDKLNRPSKRYIGRRAEVAQNPQTGKITSVNPTSTKKARKLQKKDGQ